MGVYGGLWGFMGVYEVWGGEGRVGIGQGRVG